MARINIEDTWWTDSRRSRLIELFNGNSRLADGLMIQTWRLAQNHCETGTIPLSQFLCLTDAELLFECDLVVLIQANAKQTPSKAKQTIAEAKQNEAILSNCQAYVRGTKEHHEWLVKRRISARKGGVKSARRHRDNGGKLQANAKQTEANAKQTQPSSSSSYSYSSSYSDSLGVNDKSSDDPSPTPTQFAWQIYVREFKERYNGTEPIRNAKINSQVSQLVKRIPSEEIENLICFYLQHPKTFYVNAMHGVGPLLQDCEKLHAEMKSGILANGYSVTAHNAQSFKEYLKSIGGQNG